MGIAPDPQSYIFLTRELLFLSWKEIVLLSSPLSFLCFLYGEQFPMLREKPCFSGFPLVRMEISWEFLHSEQGRGQASWVEVEALCPELPSSWGWEKKLGSFPCPVEVGQCRDWVQQRKEGWMKGNTVLQYLEVRDRGKGEHVKQKWAPSSLILVPQWLFITECWHRSTALALKFAEKDAG